MFLALVLAAATAPHCDEPLAQQEMNRCALQDYRRADAELNAQWRITSAAMKQSDKGIDRSYDSQPGYHETLLAAQRAWLTYRDQHCLNESFEARGGSLSPFLHSTCLIALTKARIGQLKELVESEN